MQRTITALVIYKDLSTSHSCTFQHVPSVPRSVSVPLNSVKESSSLTVAEVQGTPFLLPRVLSPNSVTVTSTSGQSDHWTRMELTWTLPSGDWAGGGGVAGIGVGVGVGGGAGGV